MRSRRAEPVSFRIIRVASRLQQRCEQACLRTGLAAKAARLCLLCWKGSSREEVAQLSSKRKCFENISKFLWVNIHHDRSHS